MYAVFEIVCLMKQFFSIGALKISLEYDSAEQDMLIEKALESFVDGPCEDPDICFRLYRTAPLPLTDGYRKIFTSHPEGLWTIFEDTAASHYLISLQNIERDETPYGIIKADRDFRNFLVFARHGGLRSLSPLEYPLAELAVSGYLSINKAGIILHSACMSWQGKGFLFAGVSGSGKSTIAGIWQKEGEAEVITDERVIIRSYNHELWAFGTPWHGTAEIHRNAGVPVENIFFISHGLENRIARIPTIDAINRLVVRCFPALWHREGTVFALDYCTRIAETKDCYDFRFLPDRSAAGFLKKWYREKQAGSGTD